MQGDRFCDIIEEHEHKMLPIHGYEIMPLVTLEQAVAPLISVVNDVRHMVWIVKANCKNPPGNLSPDESASIMLYSMEWQPRDNSFYIILNKTLRHKNRSLLKRWFLYLKLVITALSKIPSKRRFVHRGVRKDVSVDYPLEKTFVWWGFSSCTSSISTLENDTFLGKSGTRTLFTIDCYSGKDIREHSMCKTEDEILLLAARQFKVISCMNAGHDLNIIQIKEIEPSYPLIEPLPVSVMKTQIHASYRNENLERTISDCSSHKISLNGQQLTDLDMKIVIKRAIIDKSCVILDLSTNAITQDGARLLADSLFNNKYLEELNFSYNKISDAGVGYLASVINSSSLKRLDLTENDISDVGAKYLAAMLAINTNLIRLCLSENRIGNVGLTLLANVLTSNNTRLELLNLSANKNIDDESIDSIINMMKDNQSLKRLDLRHNSLSEDGENRLRIVAKSKLWLSHFI